MVLTSININVLLYDAILPGNVELLAQLDYAPVLASVDTNVTLNNTILLNGRRLRAAARYCGLVPTVASVIMA